MTNSPYFILPGPEGFKGALLDQYLAAGYYRMLHTVFTTNHTRVQPEGENLPVFWLRTSIHAITESSAALVIRKKCAGFSVTYKKAGITPETEALYSLYHSAIEFSTSSTSYDCLHDNMLEDPFDSWMVEIRDGNMLVAVGYFDLGEKAISGILNFYHPAYKKNSLGKYLILKKIDWALCNDISFYYTGYISTSIPKFDYKLFPATAAIELYLPVEAQWVPYNQVKRDWLHAYYQQHLM